MSIGVPGVGHSGIATVLLLLRMWTANRTGVLSNMSRPNHHPKKNNPFKWA